MYARVLLQSARVGGLLVIALGVGLMTFCVVVLAHEVLPLVVQPYSLSFYSLRVLLVVVSFQILFHYVCATAFAARLTQRRHSSRKDDNNNDDDDQEVDDGSDETAWPWRWRRAMTTLLSSRRRERHDGEGSSASGRTATNTTTAAAARAAATDTQRAQLLDELERLARQAEAVDAATRRRLLLDAPRRYCTHCRRLKAPREHHCRLCGACVAKLDHHCPWLNNCVSVANERHFVLFVLWLWCGAAAAALVTGVAYVRQGNYEAALTQAHEDVRSDDMAATTTALLQTTMTMATASDVAAVMTAPYGVHGHRLVALPVFVTLICSAVVFVGMCFFALETLQHVWCNCTPIEALMLYDRAHTVSAVATTTTTATRATTTMAKAASSPSLLSSLFRWLPLLQHMVRRTTRHTTPQRSPYDCGAWRNILTILGARDDPVVRYAVARLHGCSAYNNNSNKTMMTTTTRAVHTQQLTLLLSRPRWSWREALVLAWLVLLPSLRPCSGDGVHYVTFYDEADAMSRAFAPSSLSLSANDDTTTTTRARCRHTTTAEEHAVTVVRVADG